MEFSFAGEDLVASSIIFPPETKRNRAAADAQVMKRDLRKPPWQSWVYTQRFLLRVGIKPEYCTYEVEHAACRPCLRHISPEILHGKGTWFPACAGIELRKAIKSKVTSGLADIARDHRRFRSKAITLK